MPHPVFVRHVTRMQAVRAQRLLDLIQAQAVPHMPQREHRAFIARLVSDAQGVVAHVAADEDGVVHEQVIWNGKALGTAREIKRAAFTLLAPGAVA